MSYTIQELRSVCLWASGGMQEYPTQDMDEVHPSLFLGNAASARDIERLRRQNIGYVMNAAHGTDASLNQMIVHPKEVYQAAGIEYCGIPAIDMMSYPLYEHFGEATEFIRKGLQSGKGVLVHCKQGISRSAALVIAYLVQAEGMDVKQATRKIREGREIMPNEGFLQHLCKLTQ